MLTESQIREEIARVEGRTDALSNQLEEFMIMHDQDKLHDIRKKDRLV
jgi:hypothetical protein